MNHLPTPILALPIKPRQSRIGPLPIRINRHRPPIQRLCVLPIIHLPTRQKPTACRQRTHSSNPHNPYKNPRQSQISITIRPRLATRLNQPDHREQSNYIPHPTKSDIRTPPPTPCHPYTHPQSNDATAKNPKPTSKPAKLPPSACSSKRRQNKRKQQHISSTIASSHN